MSSACGLQVRKRLNLKAMRPKDWMSHERAMTVVMGLICLAAAAKKYTHVLKARRTQQPAALVGRQVGIGDDSHECWRSLMSGLH